MYIHVYTHKNIAPWNHFVSIVLFLVRGAGEEAHQVRRPGSSWGPVPAAFSAMASPSQNGGTRCTTSKNQQKPAKTHVSHEYPTATTLQSECRLLINHWVFWAPYFWDLLLPWSTEVADANGHAGLVFGATVTNSALVETHKLKQVMFEKSETIGRIRTERVIDLWQDNDCQGQRTINND